MGLRMRSFATRLLIIAGCGWAACDDLGGPDAPCVPLSGNWQIMLEASEVMIVGRAMPLHAAVRDDEYYPETHHDRDFRWTSSNSAVLEVSGDSVRAVKSGTATLSAHHCDKLASTQVLVETAGYSVTPIGHVRYVTGINDSGDVVGEGVVGSDLPAKFLWRDGVAIDLGDCGPTSVNNKRQVGCGAQTKGPRLWENGVIATLDTITNFSGMVNDSGHMAGARHSVTAPFILWRAPGVFDTIPFHCWPAAINQKSKVGGTYFSPNEYPCRNTGQGTVSFGGRYARVLALNDSGVAVGFSEFSPMRGWLAVLWPASSAIPVALVPGAQPNPVAASASGINNADEVIGGGNRGAFLRRNGKFALLSAVVLDPEWRITSAGRINNRGDIVATGVRQAETVAVLLRRVP